MKKVLLLICVIFLNLCLPRFLGGNLCFAQTREVPFTLADRDRIIQIEEKLNSQQVQLNDIKEEIIRLRDDIKGNKGEIRSVKDELRDEIKSLRSEFHFGFGIIVSILIFMFGFIVWDRRTAVKPAGKKPLSLIKKEKLLESILKDYAKKQPELAEILKTHGL